MSRRIVLLLVGIAAVAAGFIDEAELATLSAASTVKESFSSAELHPLEKDESVEEGDSSRGGYLGTVASAGESIKQSFAAELANPLDKQEPIEWKEGVHDPVEEEGDPVEEDDTNEKGNDGGKQIDNDRDRSSNVSGDAGEDDDDGEAFTLEVNGEPLGAFNAAPGALEEYEEAKSAPSIAPTHWPTAGAAETAEALERAALSYKSRCAEPTLCQAAFPMECAWNCCKSYIIDETSCDLCLKSACPVGGVGPAAESSAPMDPQQLLVQAAAAFAKQPGHKQPVEAAAAHGHSSGHGHGLTRGAAPSYYEDEVDGGGGGGGAGFFAEASLLFDNECFFAGDCFVILIAMSILPYVGRFLQTLGRIVPCGRTSVGDIPTTHLTPSERRNGVSTVSWGNMGDGRYEGRAGWEKARCHLNMTWGHAVLVSITRLVIHHLMQPIVYGLVLSTYVEQVSPLQEDLGFVVAVRELTYATIVVYGLLVRPAFLLCNLDAEELAKDRTFEKLMYVLAPEKFVALAVMKDGPEGFGMYYGLLMLPIDCCAIAALACGLHMHTMPYALAIGYIATVCSFTATGGMCWSWWPAHGPNAGRHDDDEEDV
jgi:hypothetical protein